MRPVNGALVLVGLLALPIPAQADEPGVALSRYPHARRVVVERPIVTYRRLVPACWETIYATLLACAPRVYVYPSDLGTLNELDAPPSRVRRPYPYLFSW
jgi:hypothetical protein